MIASPPGSCVRFALAVLLAAGCSCPQVRVEKYFPRDTACGAVRHFQLAMDLEMWSEAAACLTSAREEVGSWKLWALSGIRVGELGDFSLRQVVCEVYWVAEEPPAAADRAVVAVLSKPAPGVDQLYLLALRKRGGLWSIDLDTTFELNV